MESIDKIIFNMLASRRPVVLPGVGTLHVERRAAVVSGHDVKAPENRVAFSKTEHEGVQTLPQILESMGMGREHAHRSYEQWLDGSTHDDRLTINDVGSLHQGRFSPAAQIEHALNPTAYADSGHPERPRNKRCLTHILLIVITALLLLLASLFAYNTFYKKWGCAKKRAQSEAVTQQPAQVAPETVEPVVTNDATTAVPAVAVKRFHVAAGAFAIEQNADRLIARLVARYPDLQPQKVTYRNGLTVVSLFSSDNRNEVVVQRRALARSHDNQEYWIAEIE